MLQGLNDNRFIEQVDSINESRPLRIFLTPAHPGLNRDYQVTAFQITRRKGRQAAHRG
jgi:hypothetical protein